MTTGNFTFLFIVCFIFLISHKRQLNKEYIFYILPLYSLHLKLFSQFIQSSYLVNGLELKVIGIIFLWIYIQL